MNAPQLDAFVSSASAGIEFDDLTVSPTDDRYRAEIPGDRLETDEKGLRKFAEENPWYVSNWYYWTRAVGPAGARYAFLRWIERADERPVGERYEALSTGVSRSWGQLRITASLGEDGKRRYALRHVDDENSTGLESYSDPLAARELVKHDDRGRYRPLSTAPTLPTGWEYPDLSGDDLVRTVDFVYPATVENWHREREGELDVTHFREAAERQSGIYSIVSQLSVEELEAAAETCCVDSHCLKRRQWDEDEETALDVERGSGEFPCREPCSLFITAARKFVTLGREDTRSYEFDLTPTEKEQIEEIIDAVAEGRTDEIREADLNEGANRYRARYLRARRLEDGELSGTPTYPDDQA
ncbi:DR2241 family protein [Halalkalicoccus subterraneus]|uniref:DR2241 family protein n=1 Tax=Halalkalicoccus subterraneus TaxID=2675002 RepID=UPI000EFC4D89|nr:DR2241 family protein [Halalkalicoccus subterraneus]